MRSKNAQMTNQFTDEQVEAAARVLDPDAMTLTPEEFMDGFGGFPEWSSSSQAGRREAALDAARAALAAADAVVTVEMIAAALHGDECPDDPDEGESCGCDGNHYMRQGGIVLALLRGGEER